MLNLHESCVLEFGDSCPLTNHYSSEVAVSSLEFTQNLYIRVDHVVALLSLLQNKSLSWIY